MSVLHSYLVRFSLLQSKCSSAVPPSFADLVESVKDSVVNISTTQTLKENPMQPFLGPNSPFHEFFGEKEWKQFFGEMPQAQMKTHALGSGFLSVMTD